MAVPAGTYGLNATVDLSPVFGVQEVKTIVRIQDIPDDLLDQRLAELSSEDANVRRTALYDLRWFKDAEARVVPALLGRLDDEDATIRRGVLGVLTAYPTAAAKHTDRFLAILDESEDVYTRSSAAFLLARCAPPSDAVREALEEAVEQSDERMRRSFQAALTSYDRRANAVIER